MRLSLRGIAVFGLAAFSAPELHAQSTGNDIVNLCQHAGPRGEEACTMYIVGAVRGIEWGVKIAAFEVGAQDDATLEETSQFFSRVCAPKFVTSRQNVSIVLKYLDKNPEEWHEPAVSLIHSALIEAFPCS